MRNMLLAIVFVGVVPFGSASPAYGSRSCVSVDRRAMRLDEPFLPQARQHLADHGIAGSGSRLANIGDRELVGDAFVDEALDRRRLRTAFVTEHADAILEFSVRHHFEQNTHVHHRLERYRAGRRMDFETARIAELL